MLPGAETPYLWPSWYFYAYAMAPPPALPLNDLDLLWVAGLADDYL